MKSTDGIPTTRRARAGRGRLLILLAGGLTLCLLASVLAAGRVYDQHLQDVTGRSDTPRVSCFQCHGSKASTPMASRTTGPRYADPIDLEVAPDGTALFVVARGMNQLLEVNPEEGRVRRRVDLKARPYGLDVSADGATLAVSQRGAGLVALVDARTFTVERQVEVGPEPTGVRLGSEKDELFVATSSLGTLEGRSLRDQGEVVALRAGEEPMAVALSPDGSVLAVANQRVNPGPQDRAMASELTLVDAATQRVTSRRALTSAHLARDVAFTPDGRYALVPVVHFRNLLPITQVRRGAVMTSALVVADVRPGGKTGEFPLDELNAYFADPSGVAVTPDGRIAFVSHGGANTVTAIDLEAVLGLLERTDGEQLADLANDLGLTPSYVLGRVRTESDPGAMAVSPDGSSLYVAERLNDSVAVIDVERLTLLRRIDLGGPEELTDERLGERVFHDASITFQGQFSCRSCHPEGNTDSLLWDFEIDGIGKNLIETRSLRGIKDTPPFKWNGKNPNLQTQCGPRFARVLTRSDPFPEEDLEHLVAFIESIPPHHSGAASVDPQAVARGEELFFRTRTNAGDPIPVSKRCATCHRPPLYTNLLMSDVGSGGRFDTPHLVDVADTGPYLHDGRARTLEEIWTVYSPHDEHGVTNDMSKGQLNDLVAFLRSL